MKEKLEELRALNALLDRKKKEFDDTSDFNLGKKKELGEDMYSIQRKINKGQLSITEKLIENN